MSEAAAGATQPSVVDTEGFVRPDTPAELEAAQAELRRQLPRPDIPLMGNVDLVLELTGEIPGERPYDLHGVTYRVSPTSYAHGLQLSQLRQRLEKMMAAQELVDHAAELREVYADLRAIYRQAVPPAAGSWPESWASPEAEPFYDLDAVDYARLTAFLLDLGDECPIAPPVPKPNSKYRRDNAAQWLLTYLARFGAIEGMVIKGKPASWRHFALVQRWVIQDDAERLLDQLATFVMPNIADKDVRTAFVEEIGRRAGFP